MGITIILLVVLVLAFGCSKREEAPLPQPDSATQQPGSQVEAPKNDAFKDSGETPRGSELSAAVVSANSPPRIRSVPFTNPYVHRGVDIEAAPETEDADGDLVTLHYRWFINNDELLDQDSPVLEGGRFSKGDKLALWVTPSDQDGEGPVFYGSEFEIPNAPPVFVSAPPRDFQTTSYEYTAQATDPDGDPLTYTLETAPSGMQIDSQTGQIAWTISADSVGSHQIKIVAQDNEGARVVQEYTLTLSPGE